MEIDQVTEINGSSDGVGRLDRSIPPWGECRLKMDLGSNSLGQPVQHVRPQGPRAFEEVAKYEHIESDLCGNLC
jgi:hypothetical protein